MLSYSKKEEPGYSHMTKIKSKSVKTQCQTLDSQSCVDKGREQLLLSGSAVESTHSVSNRLRPAPLHGAAALLPFLVIIHPIVLVSPKSWGLHCNWAAL